MFYSRKHENKLKKWKEELYKENVSLDVIRYSSDCIEVNEKLENLDSAFYPIEKKEFFLLEFNEELDAYLILDKDVEISTNDWSSMGRLGDPGIEDIKDFENYFIKHFKMFYPKLGSPNKYSKEILDILISNVDCDEYYFLEFDYKKYYKEAYENTSLFVNNVEYKTYDIDFIDYSIFDKIHKINLGNNTILCIKENYDAFEFVEDENDDFWVKEE